MRVNVCIYIKEVRELRKVSKFRLYKLLTGNYTNYKDIKNCISIKVKDSNTYYIKTTYLLFKFSIAS